MGIKRIGCLLLLAGLSGPGAMVATGQQMSVAQYQHKSAKDAKKQQQLQKKMAAQQRKAQKKTDKANKKQLAKARKADAKANRQLHQGF
jgi:hypothetical protein